MMRMHVAVGISDVEAAVDVVGKFECEAVELVHPLMSVSSSPFGGRCGKLCRCDDGACRMDRRRWFRVGGWVGG